MKIVIITGEESGDELGASLVDALKESSLGKFELYGIGGSLLLKRGIQNFHHINEISVMGIIEVIPKILKINRIIKNVTKSVLNLNPDIVITIEDLYPKIQKDLINFLKDSKLEIDIYFKNNSADNKKHNELINQFNT